MAQIKSKWWRRNTPEWPESPDRKAREYHRKETEYLRWLAAKRGFGEVCPQCKGRGQMAAIFGARPCGYCDGPGGSGITRARAYVSAQRDELDMIALRAVDGLKHRLFWRGLRPVVCGGREARAHCGRVRRPRS
jgi:hypothetical protein